MTMNKFVKRLCTAAALTLCSAALSVSVFAEDFEIDVSDAKQSTGSYGQSLIYYTCLGNPDAVDNFDPTTMTDDSMVHIEYTLEGDYPTGDDGYISAPPVQLIWQSWEGGSGNSAGAIWAQVAPYEFDEKSASFSFDDIAAAYGTEDFSTVYAINVGDTGVKVTVTKMTVTNVRSSGGAAAETEITESKAIEVTLTSAAIIENAPTEVNAAPIVLGIAAGVAAVAVIVVLVVLTLKKSKRKYY